MAASLQQAAYALVDNRGCPVVLTIGQAQDRRMRLPEVRRMKIALAYWQDVGHEAVAIW